MPSSSQNPLLAKKKKADFRRKNKGRLYCEACTSSHSEYQNLKVVLIDGESLIDLMLKHGIGCRVKQKYEVFEMDQNYFDESE